MGILVLLLALASLGWSTYTQVRYSAVTACQTRINQDFLSIIKERSQLSNENTTNINKLIVELFDSAKNTPAQDTAEEKAFLTELDKVNGELQRTTYPDIGDC